MKREKRQTGGFYLREEKGRHIREETLRRGFRSPKEKNRGLCAEASALLREENRDLCAEASALLRRRNETSAQRLPLS